MPDTIINIDTMTPSSAASGTSIEFEVPPLSIRVQTGPGRKPVPLPPGQQLICVRSVLTGQLGDVIVDRCTCLDPDSYRIYQFEVPSETPADIYDFSATFQSEFGGVVATYEFQCPETITITDPAGTHPCQIESVTPRTLKCEEMSRTTFRFRGTSLDSLRPSTIKMVDKFTGQIFTTQVVGRSDTAISIKIRNSEGEFSAGAYTLRAQKTPEAISRDPSPVVISPAVFIMGTKS